jgi:hypothetical protein
MSTRTQTQVDSILYSTKANMFQKTQEISDILNTGYSNEVLDIRNKMFKQSNLIFVMDGIVASIDEKSVAADYSVSNNFNRVLPSGYVQNNYWNGY